MVRTISKILAMIVMVCSASSAATYSIPAEKVNNQKIYRGSATGFDKPAKISYEDAIKATPEYTELHRKKVEPGTGRYWILLSKASDRVARTVSELGQETGYDFIAAQAYLGSFEPKIPSDDITPLLVDRLKDEDKSNKEKSLLGKLYSKLTNN